MKQTPITVPLRFKAGLKVADRNSGIDLSDINVEPCRDEDDIILNANHEQRL